MVVSTLHLTDFGTPHEPETGESPRVGEAHRVVAGLGGDYFGRGVHEAARVATQAGANEILASESTLAATDDRFDITDRRSVELKGVSEPVVVATVTWR